MSANTPYVKLSLAGDAGVGKTCLLLRYTSNTFTFEVISTIGVDYRFQTIKVDGREFRLQIWDTAGHERYRSIATSYFRNARGILLVLSVDDSRSFDNLRRWIKQIEEAASSTGNTPGTPTGARIYICMNKIDLERKDWQVDQFEVETFVQEHGLKLFCTSAREGINVDKMFYEIGEELVRLHFNADSTPVTNPAGAGTGNSFKLGSESPKKEKEKKDSKSCC